MRQKSLARQEAYCESRKESASRPDNQSSSRLLPTSGSSLCSDTGCRGVVTVETGYNTEPLQDDLGLLCVQVSDTLSNMGVEPPEVFPPELDRYFNGVDDESDAPDPLWELLETNPYSAAIHDIFESLNDVWGSTSRTSHTRSMMTIHFYSIQQVILKRA